MSDLQWDEFEVSEFFLHDSAPLEFDDEQGRLYRASDGRLAAEVIVLPVQGVVCFTIRDAETGQIVVDLSVHPHTELSRRRAGSTEYLYCHECAVLPGIHAYARPDGFTFHRYLDPKQAGPVLSLRFTAAPRISLQFLDAAHGNRAPWPGPSRG